MTEGPPLLDNKPMCIRIWLEVGHSCEPRRSSQGRALAIDWRVWVKGASGRDISSFVHKVVFQLHPASAFVYPKRVIQEPPYEIQESGCASIDIPIQIYLKNSDRPKKIKLKYTLSIENEIDSNTETSCVFYDFENPSELLKTALIMGGGEIIARTGSLHTGRNSRLFVVLSDNERKEPRHKHKSKHKKYNFIEPVTCKHNIKKPGKSKKYHEDVSVKCNDPSKVDFKQLFNTMDMTESELSIVSKLYLSYSSYEKSVDAIVLPPSADPIYRVPELPLTLKDCFKASEIDYVLQ